MCETLTVLGTETLTACTALNIGRLVSPIMCHYMPLLCLRWVWVVVVGVVVGGGAA